MPRRARRRLWAAAFGPKGGPGPSARWSALTMPNDAKLGLVVGVGLTIAVAIVFFSKEPAATQAEPPGQAAANQLGLQQPPPDDNALLGREPKRTSGQPTGWQQAR